MAEQPIMVDARWPAAMSLRVACRYLGVGETLGRQVLNKIQAFTYSERGERYWRREDLDAYLRERISKPFPVKAL